MRSPASHLRPAALLFTLAVGLAASAPALADWQRFEKDLMGTRVSIELWHADPAHARRCGERFFDEVRRIDGVMSSYRDDSELSRINRNAALGPVAISDEMRRLLQASIRFSELSGGAFDITYASIGYAYDYRNARQPGEAAVAASLGAVDYRHLQLDENGIRFADGGVRIDLGGIAKGYAVDRGAEIVERCGIERAMLSAGGDSRILGDHGGRPWLIGVRHPRRADDIALRLPLADTALSTSGDYERFFIDGGERVHHIINPATGRPARASWSTTVTGPDAMTTDALSTTIFVLGAERGLALIERLAGIDAIVIDKDGKLHYSSGFQPPGIDVQ